MRTAHLADDERPNLTVCGYPWEDWQEPDWPTDDEIGLDQLPYAVRVEIRKADAQRKLKPGDLVRLCPACYELAHGRSAA